MKLKLSPQTLLILEAFLDHPAEWKYGYDLSKATGLKSGTLYPILMDGGTGTAGDPVGSR